MPTNYLHGDFAINVNNPCEIVGFADYYFIGTINKIKETTYKNPVTIETEDGNETISTPYTTYEVSVVENIKGNLPRNTAVNVTKTGGVSEDKGSIIVYENDKLMDVGNTYVIAASVQPDGSLLVSGSNSNELVSDNNSHTIQTNKFKEYYDGEITYERERFKSIYE